MDGFLEEGKFDKNNDQSAIPIACVPSDWGSCGDIDIVG